MVIELQGAGWPSAPPVSMSLEMKFDRSREQAPGR
jgi:hypothetical protein